MSIRSAVIMALSVFCPVGLPPGASGDDVPVLNERIEILHAERMNYPLEGRIHAVEGAVVVKVETSHDGTVSGASAITGPKMLIADSVNNAKKWIFRRPHDGIAVIVYIFQIRGACELPCPSNFILHPPNLVMVSVGRPFVAP